MLGATATPQQGGGEERTREEMGREGSLPGRSQLLGLAPVLPALQNVSQLQYRQVVQEETHSQGEEGLKGRVEGGEGGVRGGGRTVGLEPWPLWRTLAPWCPSCHCWAVLVSA